LKSISKIKTILVGLGRIASSLELDPYRNKPCTHSGVLFSNWGKSKFELQGIYDSDPQKVNAFLNQWNIKKHDLQIPNFSVEELKKQGFDFGIVATKSNSHFLIASQMIKAGIKNILVEKPVSLNSKDAKQLKNLADKMGAKIWINHERRYHPRYEYVKNQIDSGMYGQVQSVRANVFTSAKNPGLAFSKVGGGPLLHDGTHAIDLLFWLFGKLYLRYANVVFPNQDSIEDRATAWFTNKNSIEIFLDVSGGREYFQFEIDIFTSKKRIILSNDGFQIFDSKNSKLYKGFQSLVSKPWKNLPKLERSNAFLGIYHEIWQNITKKTDYQEGTLQDNIDILECIESIYKFRRKK